VTEEATKPGFAVLDFETNGLGPWEDILEIGVVLLDSDLNIEDEFGTLVDSKKRVKNPWAHGIDNPQLIGAPTEPVAFRHLLHLLSGRYVVAHNAGFEKRFLEYHSELLGLGGEDLSAVQLIDTMPIAQELCGKRKLTEVSNALGLIHNAHTALSDAQVTAMILQRAAQANSKKFATQLAAASVWPKRFSHSQTLPSFHRLSDAELERARSAWLETVAYGSETTSDESVELYRELVTLFSLNFDLSSLEKAELVSVIEELKLDRATVESIHQQVLNKLLAIRFPNAMLSRRTYLLSSLAQNLGVSVASDKLISNGADLHDLLKPGHKLMLSGKLSENQDRLSSVLQRRGFVLTKDLSEADVVVIGYKDSTNKLIREARAQRTPVIAELSLMIFLG
jgi:DNA polymerase III epsilon subunit-like protein